MPTTIRSLGHKQWYRFLYFFVIYLFTSLPAGFSLSATFNWLTAKHIDAAQLATYSLLIGLPWGFVFIWGPLLDTYYLRSLGKRRSWILIATGGAIAALIPLLFIEPSGATIMTMAALLCGHSFFSSLIDISADGLAIETTGDGEKGRISSCMMVGKFLGVAIGASGFSYTLNHFGFHSSLLLLIGILSTLSTVFIFFRENDSTDKGSRKKLLQHDGGLAGHFKLLVKSLFTKNSIHFSLVILAFYIFVGAARRIVDLHLIQNLGVADSTTSNLRGGLGSIAGIATATLGGWIVDRYGSKILMRTSLVLVAILYVNLNLCLAYGVSSAFTYAHIVADAGMVPLIDVAVIPLFMRLCNKSIAGSQFAIYMALSNLSDIVGIYMSGALIHRIPISVYLSITSAVAITIAIETKLRLLRNLFSFVAFAYRRLTKKPKMLTNVKPILRGSNWSGIGPLESISHLSTKGPIAAIQEDLK